MWLLVRGDEAKNMNRIVTNIYGRPVLTFGPGSIITKALQRQITPLF